jgi:DNA polymerase (family 10)
MENVDIAKIFFEIANILEIKGENPFRIRSYRNAGLTIENLALDLKAIIERDESELEKIPNIGKSLHEKIVEIIKTGKCAYLEKLLKEIPPSLLELLKVPALGPKKIQLLYTKRGIKDIDSLLKAAREGHLRDLPGMGEKTEKKIISSIESFKRNIGRFKLSEVISYATPLVKYLEGIEGVYNVAPAGSLRRRRETVGDLDILVTCKEDSPVMDRFVYYHEVKEVLAHGETKSSVIMKCGLQTDLRVLDRESFGAALHYFTGSKDHNVAMRGRAKKIGFKINEYGIFKEEGGERVGGKGEEEIFSLLGLDFIPPELRENRGEIEAAELNSLPNLISVKDIKGDLHMHTTESDGSNSIEEMAHSAMERGYEYIAITEHSKSLTIAHGLNEERLLKQINEIDSINLKLKRKNIPFSVLKGIEVDITADGGLDLDDSVLSQLDIVVGAVHSRFGMEKEAMTERVKKALCTGMVDILAHPTGRLINEREPYLIDMEKIMETAKRYDVALELNAFPDRLDLNDIHCKMARDMGVKVVISTDAHNMLQFDNIKFGIDTARRGWLEKGDILNTMNYRDLKKFLSKKIKGEVTPLRKGSR